MLWFYDSPIWLVELAAIIIAAGVAIGMHSLVQRAIPYTRLVKHNDVAGFLFSMVGVIYAVVLGFVVIVVWEKFDAAMVTSIREESAVSDLYRLANVYPPQIKKEVRRQILDLARTMLDQEWPAMSRGANSREAWIKGENLTYTVEMFQPAGPAQNNLHTASIGIIERFLDARRDRLHEQVGAIYPLLWWTLLVGAFSTIGFTYFFGTENRRMQLVMTGVIAVLIATMFVLIAEFDRPFAGRMAIEPDIWAKFLHDAVTTIR